MKKKYQALTGIRIHDFCVTGVMLFHVSYQIKPHKRVVFVDLVFSGRNTPLKYMNSMVAGIQQ